MLGPLHCLLENIVTRTRILDARQLMLGGFLNFSRLISAEGDLPRHRLEVLLANERLRPLEVVLHRTW